MIPHVALVAEHGRVGELGALTCGGAHLAHRGEVRAGGRHHSSGASGVQGRAAERPSMLLAIYRSLGTQPIGYIVLFEERPSYTFEIGRGKFGGSLW